MISNALLSCSESSLVDSPTELKLPESSLRQEREIRFRIECRTRPRRWHVRSAHPATTAASTSPTKRCIPGPLCARCCAGAQSRGQCRNWSNAPPGAGNPRIRGRRVARSGYARTADARTVRKPADLADQQGHRAPRPASPRVGPVLPPVRRWPGRRERGRRYSIKSRFWTTATRWRIGSKNAASPLSES